MEKATFVYCDYYDTSMTYFNSSLTLLRAGNHKMMIYNNKVSHRTKSISLKNEPCLTGPNFVNYHPFIFSLDKCNGSCNALGD